MTGGSGKAGEAVVADLTAHGCDVTNVDIVPGPDPDHRAITADLTDYHKTVDVLTGADAVVHLAAIPAPDLLPDDETFRINTLSTYNVFSAATRLDVGRVVWASSETLMGIPFEREPPHYAPIDEEHPPLPESDYALSKLVGEAMASQFSRWSDIPFVGLRYSNIMREPDYQQFPAFSGDPSIRRWNLWGYVDARDVAQASRLALEAEISGSENFLIAAADTCMTTSSADLMAETFPNVPLTKDLDEHETLISIDKARLHLGYNPAHSWRSYT